MPRQPLELRQVDVARQKPVRIAGVAREQTLQIVGRQILGVAVEEVGDSCPAGANVRAEVDYASSERAIAEIWISSVPA